MAKFGLAYATYSMLLLGLLTMSSLKIIGIYPFLPSFS